MHRAAGAGGGAQLPLKVAEHPEVSAGRPEKRLRADNPKDMLLGLKNLVRRELHDVQMWNRVLCVLLRHACRTYDARTGILSDGTGHRLPKVRLSGHLDARAGSF